MKAPWDTKKYVERYNQVYAIPLNEIKEYVQLLELDREDRLADFGCGAGDLLIYTADMVQSSLGIDSSPQQLELAQKRIKEIAHENNISGENIKVISGSFMESPSFLKGYSFTRGFARKSLHHLSDDEKILFFEMISPFFEDGSLFLIEDGIFTFNRSQLEENMDEVLKEAVSYYGDKWEAIRDDFLHCLREEYPTGIDAWQRALKGGGFEIIRRWQKTCFYGGILARKQSL